MTWTNTRRSRCRAHPGTCCGNAARSRNSRNCSRNASRSSSHAAAAASLATGRGHEPRPVPRPLAKKSDLITKKICFDCFHKWFPDKPIRKVTLGRQCVVCKAQTDRTEQMIPVEAEDIPLVKQIAQPPRRVRHRPV